MRNHNIKKIIRMPPNRKGKNWKVKLEVDNRVRLLKTEIYIGKDHRLVEPWVFGPKQCNNCGAFDHLKANCNAEISCLRFTSSEHTTNMCNTKDLKCLLCGKQGHASYSTEC